MLCQFSKLFNTGLRAYKVQNVSCDLRVGVTAKCLDDLQIIGRKKLKVMIELVILCQKYFVYFN